MSRSNTAGRVYIDARDLTIRFPTTLASVRKPGAAGQFAALDQVSFALKPGQRLGLLGRNGSGKSTLLKTLAGVYPPTTGSLDVEGNVAAIFNAALGFEREATGLENIYLRCALLGMSFSQIDALVPEIVEFSELGDWVHEAVDRYSSGMALRLAFSITTAIRSDILLLDEWLGAGDAAFLEKARKRMQDMVEDASILVLATHNLNLMRSQCTEAMVLDDGEIKYLGDIETAAALYQDLRRLT
jgi:homopolymeric O-antigen transport system ATP-binding protein